MFLLENQTTQTGMLVWVAHNEVYFIMANY